MKVKVIKSYNDLQLKRVVKVGETLDVSEERAKELITDDNKAGYPLCEVFTEPELETDAPIDSDFPDVEPEVEAEADTEPETDTEADAEPEAAPKAKGRKKKEE